MEDRLLTQGNQLAGIPSEPGIREDSVRIPPKCTLTKFVMGHGAKLESPHISVSPLRLSNL